MAWCEANRVDYLFGLARNARLRGRDRRRAGRGSAPRARPAARRRAASRTSPGRRATAGAAAAASSARPSITPKGANPRFVVTSLDAARHDARALYEDVYCARGEMENRIKE